MKSRPSILLASLLLVSSLAIPVEAGTRLGRGRLNYSVSVGLDHTDSVAPRSGAPADTSLTITPAILYNRDSPNLDLSARLSTAIVRYQDADYLDSNDISFGLNGSVPFVNGPKMSGKWGIGYFDGIEENYDTATNRSIERYNVRISGNYRLGNKVSMRAGTTFSHRSSRSLAGINNNENENFSRYIGIQSHNIFGRIGAYADYRWQDRKTIQSADGSTSSYSDDGLNFGVTGNILPERLFPNLEADIRVGYQSSYRKDATTPERKRAFIEGHLGYPTTHKSKLNLDFGQNMDLTDTNRSVQRKYANLSFDYQFRPKLSFTASLDFRRSVYTEDEDQDRNHDNWSTRFQANYSLRQNWSLSSYINFRTSNSNNALNDYTTTRYGIRSSIFF